MRISKSEFISALVLCLFIGCSKQVLAPLDAEDEFERAMSFFNNKKYGQAIKGFERVIFYHAASEYVDDAQYWLGRSYFINKEYAQAIIEFDYLVKNFSSSSFLEDAYLFRAKSYLYNAPGYDKDQTETREAIGYLDEFLTRFPNSKNTDEAKQLILTARSRMAKKELESGKLYVKMQEYEAAIIYFRYIIENFPETIAISEAKYCLAGIYEKKGLKENALALYKDLLEDNGWKDKAEKRIKLIEKEQ